MNARETLLQANEIAAGFAGLQYAKKSPEDLQHWIEDEIGNQSFIALVKLDSSRGLKKNFVVFNMKLVSAVALAYDSTEEERIELEAIAENNALKFVRALENIIDISGWTMKETFRDQSFEGLGKALTIKVSLLDKGDYCGLK